MTNYILQKEKNKKEFVALLPPLFPEYSGSVLAWDTKFCSKDFQNTFSLAQEAVACVMGENETFVSFARVINLKKILTEWFVSPLVQNTLTFPPNTQSLVDALKLSLDAHKEDIELLSVLSCFFPNEMMQSLQASQNVDGDFGRIILAAPLTQEITPPDASPRQPVNKKEKSKEKKTPEKKDQSALVVKNALFLRGLLNSINQTDPLPVQKEKWNGLLKSDILSQKGVGSDAINYWFEDIFFPGSCALSQEEMDRILDLTSDHLRPNFSNPAGAFKGLFSHMRGMPFDERKHFVDTFLPRLVDFSMWGFRERFQLLQSFLEGTEKREWAFRERLGLWKGLGGDLNEAGSTGKSSDVFSDHTTTALEWMQSKKNDAWDLEKLTHTTSRSPAQKM